MSFKDLFVRIAYADVTDAPKNPLEGRFGSIGEIFVAVVNVVFYVGIALTVIFLIIGGIRYITSGGDKAGSEAARSMITNAVIGFIVVLGAFAIREIVKKLLGADFTIPAWFGTGGGTAPTPTPA